MSSDTIHLTGGIDVGNGYVKGMILNTDTGVRDRIDLPSAIAFLEFLRDRGARALAAQDRTTGKDDDDDMDAPEYHALSRS